MEDNNSKPNTVIAAERRRIIHEWVAQNGAASVATLAELLGVGAKTIRNDLDILHREGKLIRSHGGAVMRDAAGPPPPYSQSRNERLQQKSWIGAAAVDYLPDSGTLFIGSGSTAYQMVLRMSPGRDYRALTDSLEVAMHIVSNNLATVDLAGGRIIRETLSTDLSLSFDLLKDLFWDVTIMGVEAIDTVRGITSMDRDTAIRERLVIEHAAKVIVLCDSTKIGRSAYANVAPLTAIDLLITDEGAAAETIAEISQQGVEVVCAGQPELFDRKDG